MKQERRLRRYLITDRLVHQMFNKTRGAFNTHFEVPVDFVEVPEDAEIKNFSYAAHRQAIMVIVYHPSFDVVRDGEEVPVHQDPSTLELRCVAIEQSDRERLLSERLSFFQEKCDKLQRELGRVNGILGRVYAAVDQDELRTTIEAQDRRIKSDEITITRLLSEATKGTNE